MLQQHLEAGASIWGGEQAGLDQTNHLGRLFKGFGRGRGSGRRGKGARERERSKRLPFVSAHHQHPRRKRNSGDTHTQQAVDRTAHRERVTRTPFETPHVALTSGNKDTPHADRRSPSLSSTATTRHRRSWEGSAISKGGTPASMLHINTRRGGAVRGEAPLVNVAIRARSLVQVSRVYSAEPDDTSPSPEHARQACAKNPDAETK